MKLKSVKGTRDFLPEDQIIRQKVIDEIRSVFEIYGYSPLETPVLENYEVLASKYAGGAEILKETYKLQDQGKRELALRYDLTVPFARVVGSNPKLRMPFKRYAIGDVFRDGPTKSGRYREFIQCDADVVGIRSMAADAECLAIAERVFYNLNLKVIIKFNNRKLMNGIVEFAEIPKEQADATILSIDKLEKISWDGVSKELEEKGILKSSISKLKKILFLKEKDEKLVQKLDSLLESKQAKDGLEEISKLLTYTKEMNLKSVKFDISLARGLSYYTGTVYEVFLEDKSFTSSIAAGGRYDKMIDSFLGTKNRFPTVGISFGVDIIFDILKKKTKNPKKTVTDLFIVPIKCFDECVPVLQEIRNENIKVDIDMNNKSISKNLDFVNTQGIPYALIIGDNELKVNRFKLKDMVSGEEEMFSIEEIIAKFTKS